MYACDRMPRKRTTSVGGNPSEITPPLGVETLLLALGQVSRAGQKTKRVLPISCLIRRRALRGGPARARSERATFS
jgi:hypothetical protein